MCVTPAWLQSIALALNVMLLRRASLDIMLLCFARSFALLCIVAISELMCVTPAWLPSIAFCVALFAFFVPSLVFALLG